MCSAQPPRTVSDTGVTTSKRCWWCGDEPLYVAYHDREWGVPTADDTRLFEKIVLEGFQSGLSWLTILRKRERFREVFHGFEIERVARMGARDVTRLLGDAGIIRHRGKIESAINNARRAIELCESEGSLAAFAWRYEPQARRPLRSKSEMVASTDESTAMSRELRRRGWSFVGPTTLYAFMQAVGIVNDHLVGCERHGAVERLRQRFRRPGTV